MLEQLSSTDLMEFRKLVRKKTPKNNTIVVKGKYGVGDSCWALNIAHNTSKVLSQTITLDCHWNWDRTHKHSIDDTENIIDQFDYIHTFYRNKENVVINHIVNSSKSNMLDSGGRLLYGPDPIYKDTRTCNWWKFDPRLRLSKTEKKVVIWRSTFNTDKLPNKEKEILSNDDWKKVIYNLKKSGYSVVELCYRTPIRESMYHINTCSSAIGYAGMWYYFANNWQKPTIIVSNRTLTKTHSPCCMEVGDKDIVYSITNNYSDCEELLVNYCQSRYNIVNEWISKL